MQTRRTYQFGGPQGSNPMGGMMGLIVGILFFVGLFFIFQFIYKLLWWLLPVMVIATAIIDHKVLLGYFGWIGKLFQRSTLMGLLMAALTIIGAPIVGAFLLGRALLGRKVRQMKDEIDRQRNGEFVEYEEVVEDPIELPRLEDPEPAPKRTNRSDYDQMFE